MASGQTYSAREIAEALGVAKRTVNLRASRERWPRALVHSNGGESCAYPADGLPDDVRAALAGPSGADEPAPVSAPSTVAVSAYEAAPAYNRVRADQRLAVLKAWDAWRAQHPDEPLMEARPAFLAAWAARGEKGVSVSSLLRWEADYRAKGLDGLVPDYGKSAGRTTIPELARATFLALYLNQTKLSIARCREMTIGALKSQGIQVPSEDAFRRLVQSLDQELVVFAREGEGTWANTAAPFQQRTFEHQASNDTWVGDHRRFDVFCKGAKRGQAVRPWISAWLDQRSRCVVGWHIHLNPCSDTILLSFRHGALERGIPREWYIDNGTDYRSHGITGAGGRRGPRRGGESPRGAEQRYLSLADQVGIEKVTFAIPGTPQAKVVERFFKTMKDHFDRLQPSFTGGTVDEKPEQVAQVVKDWDSLPTVEELAAAFETWVRHDYNRRPHGELGGECPEAVWAAKLEAKRTAPADRLRLMMLKATRPYVLRRNGIELFGVWYDAAELTGLFGRKVYVRYDPANMGTIAVYDTDDRFLCEATNRAVAAHGADQELVREASKEKARKLRRVKEGLKAQAELAKRPDVIDAFMAQRKADAEAHPIPVPAVPTELVQPLRPSRPADPNAPDAPVVSLADRRQAAPPEATPETDDDELAGLSPAAVRRMLVKAHEENVYGDSP